MRIGKIASSAEYQMDEKVQNLLIFGIFRKSSGNLLILICKTSQFPKLHKLTNLKMIKYSKLFNFKN